MRNPAWSAVAIAVLFSAFPLAARADETSLIFATTEPAPSPDTTFVLAPWAERLSTATNGALHIDVRDGTAIANASNIYDRVESDVVQIGMVIPSLVGGKFPLTDMIGLPFLTTDAENASVAFWRLYRTGQLDAEYKDIVPLAFELYPPQGVHLTKAPAELDDLKGLRLRVVSKTGADSIARLGATPLALDPADQYSALQRGMLDGVVSSWAGMGPLHLTEVTSFHIETSLGTGMFIMFMAKARYEALPRALRQAIEDSTGEAMSRELGRSFDQRALISRRPAAAAPDKHTIVQLSPAESRKWRDTISPVIDAWTSSHPGGGKLLATYRGLLAALMAGR